MEFSTAYPPPEMVTVLVHASGAMHEQALLNSPAKTSRKDPRPPPTAVGLGAAVLETICGYSWVVIPDEPVMVYCDNAVRSLYSEVVVMARGG